jgi:hypothetical protein
MHLWDPWVIPMMYTRNEIFWYHEQGNGYTQRRKAIVSLIFFEILRFDGFHFQTTRVNEAINLIYIVGAGFSENKKGQRGDISTLSNSVTRAGFKPTTACLEGRSSIQLSYRVEKP